MNLAMRIHYCILFATCLVKSCAHIFSEYDLYFCSSFEWTRLRCSPLTKQNSYYSYYMHYNFLGIEYITHYYLVTQSYVYMEEKRNMRE